MEQVYSYVKTKKNPERDSYEGEIEAWDQKTEKKKITRTETRKKLKRKTRTQSPQIREISLNGARCLWRAGFEKKRKVLRSERKNEGVMGVCVCVCAMQSGWGGVRDHGDAGAAASQATWSRDGAAATASHQNVARARLDRQEQQHLRRPWDVPRQEEELSSLRQRRLLTHSLQHTLDVAVRVIITKCFTVGLRVSSRHYSCDSTDILWLRYALKFGRQDEALKSRRHRLRAEMGKGISLAESLPSWVGE